MKEEDTVRYSRETLPKDNESDMDRVKSLTEEEIDRAALSDPDARPATEAMLEGGEIVVPVLLDRETYDWFRRRGMAAEASLGTVLRAYKEERTSS